MEGPRDILPEMGLGIEEPQKFEWEVNEAFFKENENLDEKSSTSTTVSSYEPEVLLQEQNYLEKADLENYISLISEDVVEETDGENDIPEYLRGKNRLVPKQRQSSGESLYSFLFKQNEADTSGAASSDQADEALEEISENSEIHPQFHWNRGIIWDRDDLIEELGYLLQNGQRLKKFNFMLQRLMCDYYRNKNMQYVIYESNLTTKLSKKYREKLITFEEIFNKERMERSVITIEIRRLTLEKDEKLRIFQNVLKDFMKRESEVGSNLKRLDTGKLMPSNVVERFIIQQRTKIEQLSNVRLRFIKLHNTVEEKKEAINKLESPGPGLTVTDYQQMLNKKSKNVHKIQDSEDEIVKLRNNFNITAQKETHFQEKTYAIQKNYYQSFNEVRELQEKLRDRRQSLIMLQRKRASTRNKSAKLKKQAGLLLKKDLLCDFYETDNKIEDLKVKLEDIKLEFNKDEEDMKQLKIILNNNKRRVPKKLGKSNATEEKLIFSVDSFLKTSVLTLGTQ